MSIIRKLFYFVQRGFVNAGATRELNMVLRYILAIILNDLQLATWNTLHCKCMDDVSMPVRNFHHKRNLIIAIGPHFNWKLEEK